MARVVKDTHFELVAEIRKLDTKSRLLLGSAIGNVSSAYSIYRNRLGEILHDPVKAVPAYETWLFDYKGLL